MSLVGPDWLLVSTDEHCLRLLRSAGC